MKSLSIGIAVVGAVVMGILNGKFGMIIGGGLGYLFGEIFVLKKRLDNLETKILCIMNLKAPSVVIPTKASALNESSSNELSPNEAFPNELPADKSSANEFIQDESDEALLFDPPAATFTAESDGVPKKHALQMDTGIVESVPQKSVSGPTDSALRPYTFLRHYLSEGNLMVRTGVIVLFFGIAFLVKYAADRDLLPIELRLIAIALFAMGLTGTGWLLRDRKRSYALSLQGGGIGILYLTIFGAAKLYDLIPLVMALGIMIALVLISTVLALLQNARPLAILGTVGGFLAPILTASGDNKHVMLFSYYLLLNIGILGVAWFKAWRELNLVGFFFTFGIGAAWGINAYNPKYFATTEPFLIIFFLIYFSLSILFATRQPVNLKGYVDSTLVFGLPLTVFGLQSGLIRHMEFGLTISAVGLAGIYIISAALLWRSYKKELTLLIESFLALGIGFITLAIPLASNGHWTIGTWAVEGGALFWVGIRQQRLLSRCAGLALQIGAALFLLYLLIMDQVFISASGGMLALAILFVAYLVQGNSSCLRDRERKLTPFLLASGIIWWFVSGLHDINHFLSFPRNSQISAIFMAASLVCFNRIAIKLKWLQMRDISLGLLPYMVISAADAFEHRIKVDPFRHGWWVVWLFNFFAFYDLLRINETYWSERIAKIYHMVGAFLVLFLFTWNVAYWTDFIINTTETWPFAIWGLVPGLYVLGILVWGERLMWPVRYNLQLYRKQSVAVILLYLFCWTLAVCVEECDPAPLHYLPFFNPIDLVIFFIFLLGIRWNLEFRNTILVGQWIIPKRLISGIIGVIGWIWLSSMVIRTVHFWEKMPYDAPSLATSALVQASLSVLWSFYAMGVLFISTRKGFREGWIAGAGLLFIVVIKLFLVDLSGTGTIARIVSFVAVGILMLVIGYFSPLPPSIRKENSL